ncbi:serine hydrolase domain-containing protein [Luteococcus sediminum]
MRTRRPTLAAALAPLAGLALLCPTTAHATPTTATDRITDEHSQSARVHSAAREAAKGHRKHHRGTPNPVLERALDDLVAAGAIGVTARLETPRGQWSDAVGLRAKEGRAPARPGDRFRVASNTKMMVATLVLQEVDKGVWRLDQPVSEVMPDLFPDHPDVTFRQLLSHTSGAPNGTQELLATQITDPTSLEQLQAALSRDYTPQQHIDAINAAAWTEPGTMLYSNAGYVALGMLLEEQNQRPLSHLLRTRIFKPAGLHHTRYATEASLPGAALHEDAWMGEADGWLELEDFDPDLFGAAGAVVGTTEDLNDLTRALVTGRLVDKALVAQMMTPVTTGAIDYGLGLYRIPDPCPTSADDPYLYGHDGAAMGTLSVAFTSPDGRRQLSVAATGRDLTALPGRVDLNTVLVPMLEASCTPKS